jgi:hypothetical protein
LIGQAEVLAAAAWHLPSRTPQMLSVVDELVLASASELSPLVEEIALPKHGQQAEIGRALGRHLLPPWIRSGTGWDIERLNGACWGVANGLAAVRPHGEGREVQRDEQERDQDQWHSRDLHAQVTLSKSFTGYIHTLPAEG